MWKIKKQLQKSTKQFENNNLQEQKSLTTKRNNILIKWKSFTTKRKNNTTKRDKNMMMQESKKS